MLLMGTPTRHANEQQHRSHDEGAVWGAQPAMRPRQWFGRRLGLCQVILAQTGSVLTSAPRSYGRCMYCMHCMHGLSCPILRICMPQHNNVCASLQQSRATRPTRSNTTDCVPMIRCILLQSRKPSNPRIMPHEHSAAAIACTNTAAPPRRCRHPFAVGAGRK